MKKFLKRVAAMSALLTIQGLVSLCLTYMFRGRILNYKIPSDKHIVFMGNSQLETSVDDSDWKGVINLAQSAKQYKMMRIDLENLISQNPQIDTVFLVVSPFSIRESDADRSYEDLTYMESISYYAPYLSMNDLEELPVIAPFVKDFVFFGCFKYLPKHQKCGAYLYNTRDDMKQDQKKHKEGRKLERENIQNGDEITKLELARIADLCESHNIKLIYISTPNYDAANKYDLPHFRAQVQELQKKLHADFWDYVDYPLPDSCFSDMTHLNYKGAAVYTDILKQRLR